MFVHNFARHETGKFHGNQFFLFIFQYPISVKSFLPIRSFCQLRQASNAMKHAFIILVAIAVISQPAIAVVVSDTNIHLSGSGTSYALTVFQDEGATDYTSIWFNVLSGQTLSFAGTTVDEASDWYSTSLGDQFSQATIQSSAFPVFVRATVSGYETNALTVSLFGDFYLGVNTGNRDGTWGPDGNPPRNLFGWVHLQNTGGTISMLGNAMSYQGDGIVIGTTEVIPEPSVLGLVSVSFGVIVSLAGRFRKRTKQLDNLAVTLPNTPMRPFERVGNE